MTLRTRLSASALAIAFTLSFASHSIVGGEWVDRFADAPFMVMTDNECGATVLSEEWVLTAAHCVFPDSPIRRVNGGSLARMSLPESYWVQETVVHPKYERIMYYPDRTGKVISLASRYDFALIRLGQKIDFKRSKLKPIRIADAAFVEKHQVPGEITTMMGWGEVGPDEKGRTTHLRYTTAPIVSYEEANKFQSYGGWVDKSMIPVGWPEGGRDACSGDSGGPLLMKDGDEYVQVGVISWGLSCAVKNLYGISANLSVVPNWIKETMAKPYAPPRR